MLETVLDHLHNWFEVDGAARRGTYSVVSGTIDLDFVQQGQFYRIDGSIFNDGLHRHPEYGLIDETFIGTITPLAIPKAVVQLADEIAEYREKNPETDKVSESFADYSYTRGSGADGAATGGWQAAYRSRLNRWKKVG